MQLKWYPKQLNESYILWDVRLNNLFKRKSKNVWKVPKIRDSKYIRSNKCSSNKCSNKCQIWISMVEHPTKMISLISAIRQIWCPWTRYKIRWKCSKINLVSVKRAISEICLQPMVIIMLSSSLTKNICSISKCNNKCNKTKCIKWLTISRILILTVMSRSSKRKITPLHSLGKL